MLQTVYDWVWWDRLWLPNGVSWSDLEDGGDRVYAKATHLYAALPCALCLLLVRFAFERLGGVITRSSASRGSRGGNVAGPPMRFHLDASLPLQVCGRPTGRCLGDQGQGTTQTGGKPAPGKLFLWKGPSPVTGR